MCPDEAKVQKKIFCCVHFADFYYFFHFLNLSLTFSITPKAKELFNLPLLNLIGSVVECNQATYITNTIRKVPWFYPKS